MQAYTPQTPKGVSLHHTGAPWYGKPGPEQYLRNIQAFHTGAEREWEDIAYHFLVDLDGVIWAGRPANVMGNPSIYYDPIGLVLISFLGDFMTQEPTETQLANSAATAAWLMKKYNIPTDDGDRPPRSCADKLPRATTCTRRSRTARSRIGSRTRSASSPEPLDSMPHRRGARHRRIVRARVRMWAGWNGVLTGEVVGAGADAGRLGWDVDGRGCCKPAPTRRDQTWPSFRPVTAEH